MPLDECRVEVVLGTSPDASPEPDPRPVRCRNMLEITKRSLVTTLVRIHAGHFRITLSLCSQALLWRVLAVPDPVPIPAFRGLFRDLPSAAFAFLWTVSLSVLALLTFLYLLRCVFCFDAVRSEFTHHVGVNYLFAPSISWLLLLQASSQFVLAPGGFRYRLLWWVFLIPVLVLDVAVYGQWFTKGKRFLSIVANPTCQMSVIGNLMGARVAAETGWKEVSICLFSLGFTHYLVIFVTLYQRIAGSKSLPAMLRPVFFLFVAAPSTASIAWSSIAGSFDNASKMLFYLSLFLLTSLISRPALFRKSMKKFSLAWWAYSFPLTVLALASAQYTGTVEGLPSRVLKHALSSISIIVFIVLTVLTGINNNSLFLPANKDAKQDQGM
ncbi:hypothetical protein MLD38_033406 [Melastoma candidum]|uniref:Uncharacterized protein n=1 Tax=Melastoma candidum TaxID=119954 RepID=A0ACB9M8G5_9MYRT|nr:hypothetical protein MLD38_033406 [Melastoma candidum]